MILYSEVFTLMIRSCGSEGQYEIHTYLILHKFPMPIDDHLPRLSENVGVKKEMPSQTKLNQNNVEMMMCCF